MFDSEKLCVLGRNLVSNLAYDREARARTAIGRAYYALFLRTRAAVLRTKGSPVDAHVSHGDLSSVLMSSEDSNLRTLGITLNQLYEARRYADYKLDPPAPWKKTVSSPASADNYVKRALAALQKIDSLDFTSIAQVVKVS